MFKYILPKSIPSNIIWEQLIRIVQQIIQQMRMVFGWATSIDTWVNDVKTNELLGKTDLADLTLLNGWENDGGGYQPFVVRKVNGILFISGVVKQPTAADNTKEIFILPTGYSPASAHIASAFTGGAGVQRCDVYANGKVKLPLAPTVVDLQSVGIELSIIL